MMCIGCEWRLKPNNEDSDNTFAVERYDRVQSLYLTTGDFSALQQMSTNYPNQTRTLIEDVLKIGNVNDPEINTKFLNFYQDTTLQSIINEAEQQYANMDDIDSDGRNDCLSFIVPEIGGKKSISYSVTLSESGQPRSYQPQVYAEMLLTNKKIKSTNKQDLYISSLTVDNGTNPYWMLHHHGPAFENDMVAYRIYFDERQTVDIYGKYKRGLELRDTQFYPDSDQKAA